MDEQSLPSLSTYTYNNSPGVSLLSNVVVRMGNLLKLFVIFIIVANEMYEFKCTPSS